MTDLIEHPTATYHTTAINEAGLVGESIITGKDQLVVKTAGPKDDDQGTNPEQLIGLALVTCLNATLEAIEKRNGYEHQSKVRADVYQAPDTHGLQFFIDATVYIPEDVIGRKKAQAMFELAESRCPVAKLLGPSANVTFTLVNEWK